MAQGRDRQREFPSTIASDMLKTKKRKIPQASVQLWKKGQVIQNSRIWEVVRMSRILQASLTTLIRCLPAADINTALASCNPACFDLNAIDSKSQTCPGGDILVLLNYEESFPGVRSVSNKTQAILFF